MTAGPVLAGVVYPDRLLEVLRLRPAVFLAATPPVLCRRAVVFVGAPLRRRCAGCCPLADAAADTPLRLRAAVFLAVVLFDAGFRSRTAESATPLVLFLRSETDSRDARCLRGVGVFSLISAAEARRARPSVVFGPAVFRAARFCRPVVFLPEPAFLRPGICNPPKGLLPPDLAWLGNVASKPTCVDFVPSSS